MVSPAPVWGNQFFCIGKVGARVSKDKNNKFDSYAITDAEIMKLVFKRNQDDLWELFDHGSGEKMELECGKSVCNLNDQIGHYFYKKADNTFVYHFVQHDKGSTYVTTIYGLCY